MLPPTCMEYTAATRPRISSGTTCWMMVWVMVINPAVPSPISTAANIDMPVCADNPRPMGVRLLVNPKTRKTRPLVIWLMMPPTNMDDSSAPMPSAVISA